MILLKIKIKKMDIDYGAKSVVKLVQKSTIKKIRKRY